MDNAHDRYEDDRYFLRNNHNSIEILVDQLLRDNREWSCNEMKACAHETATLLRDAMRCLARQ